MLSSWAPSRMLCFTHQFDPWCRVLARKVEVVQQSTRSTSGSETASSKKDCSFFEVDYTLPNNIWTVGPFYGIQQLVPRSTLILQIMPSAFSEMSEGMKCVWSTKPSIAREGFDKVSVMYEWDESHHFCHNGKEGVSNGQAKKWAK